VREYRDRYPDKAVIYSAEGCDNFGWAVFMAGGSLANIPAVGGNAAHSGSMAAGKSRLNREMTGSPGAGFEETAVGMRPVGLPGNTSGQWALGDRRGGWIVYSDGSADVSLDLTGVTGKFQVRKISPADGKMEKGIETIRGGKTVMIPAKGPVVLWIGK
jgi:hypothetical protein